MEQSSDAIDPNDLLIFARVAELGSFSRAADRLGCPKSTVSRRIAGLETQLGERLLQRTTRRQQLTEFGQQLLEHARQVALEVEAVALLREQRQAAPSGRLRVSMPSDFANLFLGDMLAAFVALHPAITLELDLSPRRVDLLAEGIDVAVRIGSLPDDAWLAARRCPGRCATATRSGKACRRGGSMPIRPSCCCGWRVPAAASLPCPTCSRSRCCSAACCAGCCRTGACRHIRLGRCSRAAS